MKTRGGAGSGGKFGACRCSHYETVAVGHGRLETFRLGDVPEDDAGTQGLHVLGSPDQAQDLQGPVGLQFSQHQLARSPASPSEEHLQLILRHLILGMSKTTTLRSLGIAQKSSPMPRWQPIGFKRARKNFSQCFVLLSLYSSRRDVQ